MRIVLGLVTALGLLAWPAVAASHPLGNFTINQYDHGHAGHQRGLTTRCLLGLSLVGGLVPSVSALLVLLLPITLDRLIFGLALIVAFGVGMALVLGAISAWVVIVRDRAQRASAGWMRRRSIGQIGRAVPMLTAFAVLVIGIVVTIRALAALG